MFYIFVVILLKVTDVADLHFAVLSDSVKQDRLNSIKWHVLVVSERINIFVNSEDKLGPNLLIRNISVI